MELPTDRPHPLGGLSAKGDSIGVRVPPHTAAGLRRLTVENRTTLYVIMLSAWKVHAVLYNCSIKRYVYKWLQTDSCLRSCIHLRTCKSCWSWSGTARRPVGKRSG